jgi:5-methylcytosine-specific restriction endonuclease McrA
MRENRQPSSKRGYNAAWRAIRAAFPKGPCARCNGPWRKGMHLDHKVAKAKGGTDDPSNLQWLHPKCHNAKTIRHDGGFGKTPSSTPKVRVDDEGWPQPG